MTALKVFLDAVADTLVVDNNGLTARDTAVKHFFHKARESAVDTKGNLLLTQMKTCTERHTYRYSLYERSGLSKMGVFCDLIFGTNRIPLRKILLCLMKGPLRFKILASGL